MNERFRHRELTSTWRCLCVGLPPVRLSHRSDATCHMDEQTRSSWQRSEESNFIMSCFHLTVKQMHTIKSPRMQPGEANSAAQHIYLRKTHFMVWHFIYIVVCINYLCVYALMVEWQCCSRVCVCESCTLRVLKRGMLTDCQPIIHPFTCTNLSCRSATESLWFPRLLASPPPPPLPPPVCLSMKQIQYTVTLSRPRLAIWILSRSQKGTHRAKLIFLLR